MKFIKKNRPPVSSEEIDSQILLKQDLLLVPPPFLLLFSFVLYSIPFISTIHVQIQIDNVDTCPINFSLKSSRVVVRLKNTIQLVYKAFNATVAAFSQIFPDPPLSSSFLSLILFHVMVQCVALNSKSFPPFSALPSQEGVLPWTTPRVILIGFHSFIY